MKLIDKLFAKYEAMIARNSAKAIRYNDEAIDLIRMAVAILPDDHNSQTIKMLMRELLKEIDGE